MKIIKKGYKTKPEDIVYVLKCSNCGCVFTYKLDDTIADYDGDNLVCCPDCKRFNLIIFKRKYRGEKNVKD